MDQTPDYCVFPTCPVLAELRQTVRTMHDDASALQARVDELSRAYAGQGLAIEELTDERDRYREALRPFAALDQALLGAFNRAEFHLHGLRNRDLREALAPVLPSGLTDKQIAGRVGRLLRWLRAHGLLAKIGRTQRYRVTVKARQIATVVLAAAKASTPQLTRLAA